ncbi:MAG: energy-coupling factor transporter ATPase [Pseudanabaena sp. ELA607]
MEIIAHLDQVSYVYPNASDFALKDICLEIRKGEFLGIIGPTGAGKTTLCLTLNGIVPQFYGGRFFGYIHISDLDTLSHPVSTLAQKVGAVFEDPESQLITTSVATEIAFTLENLRVPREEILARIPEALAAVRLDGTEQKNPQELSGGQKQRLAIASALAVKPDLLILDEPTSQLDPIGSREVFATIRELNQRFGITVVMVSHAAEEMAEYADRIALIAEGSIQAVGTPQEIYSQIDLLARYNLRAPQVAQTFYNIDKTGLKIEQIPVTLDAGLQLLEKLIREQTLVKQSSDKLVNYIAANPNPKSVSKNQLSPILSTENLQHIYPDGTPALENVSLDIYQGEYVLIIGQNGAGKSTLVKHFLNLLQATSGKVLINNQQIQAFSVSSLAKLIGYVSQNPDQQIFNTTVEAEVAFALKNLGYPKEKIAQQTRQSLEMMGLWQSKNVHPLSLPKGDRSRIIIAAILAMEPQTIIFDEPTTGQDYQGAQAILEVSRQLHQMGKTVIVITHHLYLMADYADRVIVMGKGKILIDAPIREVYHQQDLLESTYLSPPQSVILAQSIMSNLFTDQLVDQQQLLPIKPEEVADLLSLNH